MSEMTAGTAEPVTPDPGTEDDDLTTLLRRRAHARPNRITWALLAVLLLGAGFVGGAWTSQQYGPSTAGALPAGLPAGMAAGFPGAASGTGAAAAATPFGDMTVGTVTLVDKRSLYLTTTSGETVKVAVPDTVVVTSQQEIDLADLAAGTAVVVRGSTAADGTVTAESVSEGSLPGGMPGAPGSTSSTPTSQGEN